jgi:hypothetical protein
MSELYMPIEARREVIRQYAKEYGCTIFVETGTADASTTIALVHDFETLYTIEIDEGLWQRAYDIFAQMPHVLCLKGDSAQVLPDLLDTINEHPKPIIFWLDGHYCGGPTRGEVDSPVVDELITIFAKAPEGSVILVDDARIFGGGAEEGLEGYTGYPHLNWVHTLANSHHYNYLNTDDIIRLTPRHV